MKDTEFVERLKRCFGNATMADVARRIGVPHATVRNYFLGRLPAPEVLIKIADETGISLNWLLCGRGEMYASDQPPIGLGRFIEEKISEMIDRRLSSAGLPAHAIDVFDVRSAVLRTDDPQAVIGEWLSHEGREFPTDFGIVFFRGWESFSMDEKVDAVRDAKRVLDRTLRTV
ncbi:MAG: helix-turn-helix domain-containing protein [Acidobacteria bacterium]|nr:helix-turn-helix domain-containing protein [Acidobacteriota bacterium]MCW5948387.1 helix-turn-helix domain-containing protein [Pyrinomonadaceae bacterium]